MEKAENMNLLIEKTETIQWLLTALLSISVLFLIVFCLGLWMFYVGGKIIIDKRDDQVFRVHSENYLGKNAITELVDYCEERLKTHPNDMWAYWYLGQAHFHAESWLASKRSFERVLELEPSWYSSIDSWLEKLSDKIDESGPKLVE